MICSHNGATRLIETLRHVMNQKVDSQICWEVLLIDNASTDNTGQLAKEIWRLNVPLRVVTEPKLGLMNARMTGFVSSKYEFVSFVDDDNWISPNWVQLVYEKFIEYPDAGAIGGGSEAVCETIQPAWFEQYKSGYGVGEQSESEGEIPANKLLWGTGAIRRSAWQAVLDKKFEHKLVGRKGRSLGAGEDREIMFMLLFSGWKLYYFPALHFQHFIPTNRLKWKYVCRSARGYGHSEIIINLYWNMLKQFRNEPIKEHNWKSELKSDLKYVIRRPLTFLSALWFSKEGDREIVYMNKRLGRLSERLKLLGRLEKVKEEIRQQTILVMHDSKQHILSKEKLS